MLSQLFPELGTNKCDYILIRDNDSIDNIINHIDNSNKEIFLIDEIIKISNINDLSILYDKYTKYGKKIIISGTESLIFEIFLNSILFDRAEIIRLLPLTFIDYVNLIKIEEDKYLKSSGLFYENKDNLILSIAENIVKSILKIEDETTYYSELIDSIIKILILKIVWTDELIESIKFSSIGIRKDDVQQINEQLIKNIIEKTPEIEYLNYKDIDIIYNYLLKLKVITEFKNINDESKIKKIIPIPRILTDLYNKIMYYCQNKNIFYSKKQIKGLLFEKEMNVQSYLTNSKLKRYTLDTSYEEVDEIIELPNNISVIDYKISDDIELLKSRINLQNINNIKEILSKHFKKEIYYKIVYNGDTKSETLQFQNKNDFLNELKNIEINKECGISWI